MSKRTKIIKCEPFKCEVLFVWNCDHKGLERELKQRKVIEKKASLDDMEHADGSQPTFHDEEKQEITRVVWLKEWAGKPDDYGRLAHEIAHLVVRICDWKGIPFDGYNNNDETFAYLVDYFITEFLEYNAKFK